MITTLTVNPAIDLTLEVNGLVVEDVNRVKHFHENIGGKGINVSKVLHELGLAKLHTLAVLGGRRSGRFERIAKSDGLKINKVQIADETRINVTIYDQLSHKTTKLNQPGPQITVAEEENLLEICLKTARISKYFLMAGSLLPGLKMNWYAKLLLNIRGNGSYVALDADGETLKKALPEKPSLIKPNRYEAERVLGKRLPNEKSLVWAGRRLREMGAQNVILSLGGEGALFSGKEGAWRGYSIPVRAKSTIGAGDSLMAGFLFQQIRGKSIPESLAFGMACGTHTATLGATEFCTKPEVMKLVSKMVIKKVNGD